MSPFNNQVKSQLTRCFALTANSKTKKPTKTKAKYMTKAKTKNKQTGVTLVELIIAIVIISIAAVALLQGLGFQTNRNVDPMIQSQAQLLARQYLQEVMAKSFYEPTADPRTNKKLSQADTVTSIADTTARDADANDRRAWDNIYEYSAFNQAPREINGTAITNLAGYKVTVSLDSSAGLTLGTLSNSATAGCPAQIILISVTVRDPRGQTTSLSGYRSNFFKPPASWGC